MNPALRTLAVLLVVSAASVAVLVPLLAANFHSDDLGWLAFARQAGTPWPAFVESQIFGYFYRPSAFVYWWLAERIAGPSPTMHYVLSIGLHAASGWAFFEWMRRSHVSVPVALLAALAVVASLPVSGTALWLSSRNETLALAAGVAALALAPGARGWRAVGAGLLLLVACTAKETGLLFAAAVVAQSMAGASGRPDWRSPALWAALLPAAMALFARQWIIVPIGPEADGAVSVATLVRDGVLPWWQHWPSALAGWGQPVSAVATAGLFALGALAMAGLTARRHPGHRGLVAAALVLVMLPAGLQSPITALVLPQDGADAFLVNLRFFATATVGLVVLAALGLDRPDAAPFRHAAFATGLVLVAASAFSAHHQASRWQAETAAMAAPMAVAGRLPAGLADQAGPACVLDVQGTGLAPGLAPYLDSAVRARAPRGHPPRCLVTADGVLPYFAFLHASACRPDAGWEARGLAPAVVDGRRFAERFGPLCQIALRTTPTGLRPSAHWTFVPADPPRP
ncbi:hypothetical protein GCM10028794_21920 [Silanimonas algicola]